MFSRGGSLEVQAPTKGLVFSHGNPLGQLTASKFASRGMGGVSKDFFDQKQLGARDGSKRHFMFSPKVFGRLSWWPYCLES